MLMMVMVNEVMVLVVRRRRLLRLVKLHAAIEMSFRRSVSCCSRAFVVVIEIDIVWQVIL